MRAFVLIALAGCANGSIVDAGRIALDSGADAGPDAGKADAGRDEDDAGHDAGDDGGRDSGVDPDAGRPQNDSCIDAIDATGGGTFNGTTCGADDTVELGTGPPGCDVAVTAGTADVFYVVHTPPGSSSYRLVITDGFAIQFVTTDCFGNGGCGPYRSTNDFTIGGGGGATWWFAIERIDGECGEFTLDVSTF